MIELYIDNKPVVLPAGFEPEIVDENPYFTKSSSYSLDIELPVKGVPENIAVFGHCYRLEFDALPKSYPAYMRINGILRFFGSAVPLETTDTGVKIQLLSGNSELNFYSDDIYIDELDLGKDERKMSYYSGFGPWALKLRDNVQATADYAATGDFYNDSDHVDCLYLPFFIKARESTTGNVQYRYGNFLEAAYSTQNERVLYPSTHVFIQPYLIKIIQRIIESQGYDIRYNDLLESFLKHVFICNYTETREYAKALPHWSLNKFFDEIEKFCAVVVVADSREKVIDIYSLSTYYSNSKVQYIDDEQILDEFVSEYSDDRSDKDITSGNVGFNLNYNDNYVQLNEDLLTYSDKREFDNYEALKAAYDAMEPSEASSILFYDTEKDRYYIRYEQNEETILREVNLYGDLIRDESVQTKTELNIVPATLKEVNIGYWSYPGDSYTQTHADINADFRINLPVVQDLKKGNENSKVQSIQDVIEGEESIDKKDTSDSMEVAIYDGRLYACNMWGGTPFNYPLFFTDCNQKTKSYKDSFPEMSLSLHNVCEKSLGRLYRNSTRMDTSHPYTIYFRTGNKQYDPKQIFMIRNQKYACESIKIVYNNTDSDFIAEGKFYRMG